MPNSPGTKKSRADREFEKPVSWLLGRQLIASLKSTLLYTAFGSKIDARDWMDAKIFPPTQKEAAEAWETMYERETDSADASAAPAPTEVDFKTADGEFWFDYISDTGDGMTATYSIAYLCLSDLWVTDPGTEKPPGWVPVRIPTKDDVQGLMKLPRGEFLMVGGDTSYHMADYASLHLRFQVPFKRAYDDLREDLGLKARADLTEDERKKEIRRLRPIFAIPGNHDYYDMLDGFRRQFREPPRSRSETRFFANPFESSQLQIPGFRRYQETSYIALRLPFDWMIWGLDTEVGKIDERQRDFFTGVKAACKPEKLIVCSSAPTTVFGEYADKDDEKAAKAFLQLDLARPFLRSENEPPEEASEASRKKEQEERKLLDREIRLDLAGDIHQYARYWGPPSPNTQPTRSHVPLRKPLERANYASVVSGLGGAFHHPSTTYVDEIREQALYPNEDDSRKQVAGEIFNPWRVVKGGGVWFFGGLLALILAFAAIADQSSRPAIHNFKLFIALGITEPEQYAPTVRSQEEAKKQQLDLRPSLISRILGFPGIKSWSPQPMGSDCETDAPVYLWGKCRTRWPAEYTWGFWMVMITVPAMLLGMGLMSRHYRAWKERVEVDIDARKAVDAADAQIGFDNDAHVKKVNFTIWGFTLGVAVMAVVSVLLIMPYRNFITPFGNSLLVLLSICWAAGATYLSLRYSDWLFDQASKRQIRRRDWAITWVLTACAFFSLAIGLWVFGKNNPAAYLVADIIFVLVAVAVPVLLLGVGWAKGGEHQKGIGKLGMALVGLWHGLLQLGVVILLIKKGTWLTFLLSAAIVLIFWWVGRALMENNWRVGLTYAWVVFGATMLLLPRIVYDWLIEYGPRLLSPGELKVCFWPHVFDPSVTFSSYEWWLRYEGWWQLVPILLAGVVGAFLSCVWLGWYFGVCLLFHGHNNETGGAARIERFKQLVRIRLKEDSLTGYVIAVDDPQRDGKLLHPHIIDIFHLTRQKEGNETRPSVQPDPILPTSFERS